MHKGKINHFINNVNSHRNLIFRFINYYIFTILSAVISFGSISYLTHKIPESGYGYIGIFTSISFLIPSLLSFNAVGLIQINIVDYSYERYVDFRNNFITFCTTLFLLLEALAIILSDLWGEYNSIVHFSLIYGYLLLLSTIHNSELIQKGKATQFGVLNFLNGALSLAIAIILISNFRLDWEGRVLSFIIAEVFFMPLRFFIFSDIGRKFKIILHINEWRYFLVYGSTLWLSLIAGWVINQSDRFILLNYMTIEDVGIYSAGAGISGFLITINSTMVKVLAPIIYKALNEKKDKDFILKFFKIYAFIIFLIALAICVFTLLFLPYFFGEKYLMAKWIICILTMAQAFFGMYQIVGLVIDYLKLNNLKSFIVSICAVSCLITGITLIPLFGIQAPAIGNLLSFILLATLTYYYANKHLLRLNQTEGK